ncbi:MAG: Panacea domain-containing protein, partial [Planktomarina sp.]
MKKIEMPLYSAQHVANFFLRTAEGEGVRITPLKLLKLVYIAYGWFLALKKQRLFNDDIQAWQHGPVIPSLYHEFKHYGKGPILELATCFDLESFSVEEPSIPSKDADTALILSTVWKSYKDFTGWSLRELTHAAGTPWSKVYDKES